MVVDGSLHAIQSFRGEVQDLQNTDKQTLSKLIMYSEIFPDIESKENTNFS